MRPCTLPQRARARRSAGLLGLAASLVLAACGSGDDPLTSSTLGGELAVGTVGPSGGDLLEQEPNDSPSQPHFVGDLGPGFEFLIRGEITDDGSDPFDAFRFRSTAVLDVQVEIAIQEAGADIDGFFYDVDQAMALCGFTGDVNPQTGSCPIPSAGFEFDVVLFAQSGASSYELRVTAAAPAAPQSAPPATLGPGERERLARYLGAQHPMAAARVVVLEDDASAQSAARAAFLAAEGLELVSRTPDGTSIYELSAQERARHAKGSEGAWSDSLEHRVAKAAQRFARQPGVRAASPDFVLKPHTDPNDTHYSLQWHYPQMNLPLAWDVQTGSPTVVVAVIDTGYRPHPDLLPRLIPGYDFISDPATSNDGDGLDPDPIDAGDGAGPQPNTYHGTHVSGTIGAVSSNQMGVAGVDWSCDVMSLRALGIGGGLLSDIAAAIRYAAGLPNASGQLPAQAAHVVNMSLGGPGFSGVLEAACDDAFAAGVTLVASAGNEPDDVPKYPAALDSVIGVGAVRYDQELAPYSSFGSWVDLVAPGGDLTADQNGDNFPDGVLSTYTNDQGEFFYAFQQGTSMASPHVAGVAALLKSASPAATPSSIRSVLRATALDLGAPGPDPKFGFGLVDAFSALNAQAGGGPPQPILAVNPATISFGSSDSFLAVSLANVGGGFLQVVAADVTYDSGSGWLTAALVPAASATDISHESVAVTIERGGLAPGSYSATVVVRATGVPDRDVQVLMSVGGGQLPDHTVFVLLVEAESYTTVDQAVTDLAAAYNWQLTEVENGRYLVVAGTDEDDDGFIGDDGEPLFGIWPSALDPTVILVTEPTILQGLDFPVATAGTIGAQGLGGEGLGGEGLGGRPDFARLR